MTSATALSRVHLNNALWSLLPALFDISQFQDLGAGLSATHAYQQLAILLFNRAYANKTVLTQKFESLGAPSVSSCAELLLSQTDLRSFQRVSVLHSSPFLISA
jgi:hypothetical protein